MIELTRRYPFSASHRLAPPALSEAENRDTYGKCNNPFGHGHNYTVEVTVRGQVDSRLGKVVDIGALDRHVAKTVVHAFDHRSMNHDIPEFAATVPTTENLLYVVRNRLLDGWPIFFPPLHRVRIFETRKNVFEIQESI